MGSDISTISDYMLSLTYGDGIYFDGILLLAAVIRPRVLLLPVTARVLKI